MQQFYEGKSAVELRNNVKLGSLWTLSGTDELYLIVDFSSSKWDANRLDAKIYLLKQGYLIYSCDWNWHLWQLNWIKVTSSLETNSVPFAAHVG